MLTDGTPLPRLPTETWIQILTEHGLSYPDLKRIARVSKGMHIFIQSTALNALLFRGGVPQATLPAGTKATLHPALKHGDDFINTSSRSFTIYHPALSNPRAWTICDLACSEEYATSPPVTELRLFGIGRSSTYITIKRAEGVRVLDMLNRIARRWCQRPSDDAYLCGCDIESYYDLYYHDGSGSEEFESTWRGWKSVQVSKEGVLVVRRRW
ncbi:hypothetical protein RQP46_004631 [Phenoliferia psychrophenolica]